MSDGPDAGMPGGTGIDDALAELDRLDEESRRREHELLELSEAVPAAVSRVELVRSLVAGARDVLPGRFRRR